MIATAGQLFDILDRMPCSITDGPQYDDEPREEIDEDEAYENHRQQEIDEEHARRVTDGLLSELPDIMR